MCIDDVRCVVIANFVRSCHAMHPKCWSTTRLNMEQNVLLQFAIIYGQILKLLLTKNNNNIKLHEVWSLNEIS